MISPELIIRFHNIEHFFFSAISTNVVNFESCVSAYFTGVRSQYLNPILHVQKCGDISTILEACNKLYRQQKLPWVWVSRSDLLTPDLKNILSKAKLELKYESTAMVYNLENLEGNAPSPTLGIRCLHDDLSDWLIPVYQAFGSTKKVGLQYKHAHERMILLKDSFFHFVGYLGSKPVCALTLSFKNGIARIDDVATLPCHQGRGYGTEIMRYALGKAAELGAHTCFLEASKEGVSIYEKIGFKSIFSNKIFGKFAS